MMVKRIYDKYLSVHFFGRLNYYYSLIVLPYCLHEGYRRNLFPAFFFNHLSDMPIQWNTRFLIIAKFDQG